MKNLRASRFIGVLFLLASGFTVNAAIVANFDEGNTNAEVDAYLGKAGDGWVSAWALGSNNGVAGAGSVVTTAPLAGGANYLYVTSENNNLSGSSGTRVSRRYDSFGPVQINQAHSISLHFRMDNAAESNTLRIFDDATGRLADSTDQAWKVQWRPSVASAGFQFTSGGTGTFADSNVRLFEGDTYFIQISFSPGAGTGSYVGYVENLDFTANNRTDGVASFTSGTLSLSNSKAQPGGYLNFSLYTNHNPDPDTPATGAFSLDSIHVIPEPGTLALLAVAGGILALRRRSTARSRTPAG